MNKQEQLQTAQHLINTYLPLALANKTYDFPLYDQESFKQLYSEIYKVPQQNLSLICPTCIKTYLSMLEAWYQRESPLFETPTAPKVEEKKQATKKKK